MLKPRQSTNLELPFSIPPSSASVTEVAPGILWTRIPLPFRLDHVNIYLIEDAAGWAVVDTGVDHEAARAAWEVLLAGPLYGKRLTRLIVTHFHPDHIGLAGWLCQRFDLPLLTSQTSYLTCLNMSLSPGALDAKPYHDFYASHGLDPATTAHVTGDGNHYLKMVTKLPPTFMRVVAGDTLSIGGRTFSVMTSDGHAPEQVMLYCRSDNIFLCADQVIVKITPNVSVWAVDPEGDPLGLYLRSLAAIARDLPTDPLVLPGHQLPFRGLEERCHQLADHHQDRCDLIAGACQREPHSVADLVPVLFPRPLDPHQLGFAFSEVHAHVNYMLRLGELRQQTMADGTVRVAI